jgi:hypothetical protein
MVAISTATRFSSEDTASTTAAANPLDGLSEDLGRALDVAFWALDFRGDLEDALDGAFLRSVLASTPTLSGGLLSSAA